MYVDAALAMGHHLCAFGMFVILATEFSMLRRPLNAALVRTLARVDLLYGIVALVGLGFGLTRAVYGIKGWAFYSSNPIFWSKLALFVVIGVISIRPTIMFLRWRKIAKEIDAAEQALVARWVTAQLVLIFVLPLLAVLMARGIGISS
jgi:putative membrane protein